jgi:hypothetical protein
MAEGGVRNPKSHTAEVRVKNPKSHPRQWVDRSGAAYTERTDGRPVIILSIFFPRICEEKIKMGEARLPR